MFAIPALVNPATAQLWGHPMTDWAILAVFATVYLGMFLGGLPRLKLDRTGVALLGAIAVIALTGESVQAAARSVDLPTIVLLFAFMVVAAQLRLGGFYSAVARWVGAQPLSPAGLLAALVAAAAALSAVFSNDVVCLAMTPVVVQLCVRHGHNPVPFLLGLVCAANIGSAATLIGNPQNMLLGSVLKLDFAAYVRFALPPVAISLLVLWLWLVKGPGAALTSQTPHRSMTEIADAAANDPPFDSFQSTKGLLVATTLLVIFLFTAWPRDVAALVGAGVLLLSRRLRSEDVMGYVDWPLLLLFAGLFVVNHALSSTGLAGEAVAWMATQGVHLRDPAALLVVGVVLANLVSNVPAVMLLLPHLEPGAPSGMALALTITLAGNLLLVGSIANLIVVDLARKNGVTIDWKQHAVVGVPVSLMTLTVVAWWVL